MYAFPLVYYLIWHLPLVPVRPLGAYALVQGALL
jgi:hypothetical protein